MTAPATNSANQNILKVVVMRLLRLGASGAYVIGADAQITAEEAIMLQYTPISPDREQFKQEDGDGDTCAFYIGPPRAYDAVEMKLQVCTMYAELEEMLCGGSIITDSTYGTIGYKPPEDSTVNAYGVALETWSIAWNRKQRAKLGNSPAYWRHVFPMTAWKRDQASLQNGFDNPSFTGFGQVNSGFGTGLAADPLPASIGNVPYEWFLDDAKPAGVNGYQAAA